MRIEPRVRWAYVAAIAALLTGAATFHVIAGAVKGWLLKDPAPLRESLGTIPTTLGRWKAIGTDEQLGAEMIEELGTKIYLTRTYAIDGDPAKGFLQLHLAYYTGLIDRVPHVPDRCFTAAGHEQLWSEIRPLAIDRSAWREGAGPAHRSTGEHYPMASAIDPITRATVDVHLPLGEAAFSLGDYRDRNNPNLHLLGGYLFIANGRMTPRAQDIRSLAYSLTERYAYFCKVQFVAQFRGSEPDSDAYTANVADLFSALLPHLMQRLPDWPEYEAMTAPAKPAASTR